jgi:hypothetical protein
VRKRGDDVAGRVCFAINVAGAEGWDGGSFTTLTQTVFNNFLGFQLSLGELISPCLLWLSFNSPLALAVGSSPNDS